MNRHKCPKCGHVDWTLTEREKADDEELAWDRAVAALKGYRRSRAVRDALVQGQSVFVVNVRTDARGPIQQPTTPDPDRPH